MSACRSTVERLTNAAHRHERVPLPRLDNGEEAFFLPDELISGLHARSCDEALLVSQVEGLRLRG